MGIWPIALTPRHGSADFGDDRSSVGRDGTVSVDKFGAGSFDPRRAMALRGKGVISRQGDARLPLRIGLIGLNDCAAKFTLTDGSSNFSRIGDILPISA